MISEISKDEIRGAIEDKLSAYFCVTSKDATDDQVFQSAAMVLREMEELNRQGKAEHLITV